MGGSGEGEVQKGELEGQRSHFLKKWVEYWPRGQVRAVGRSEETGHVAAEVGL